MPMGDGRVIGISTPLCDGCMAEQAAHAQVQVQAAHAQAQAQAEQAEQAAQVTAAPAPSAKVLGKRRAERQ